MMHKSVRLLSLLAALLAPFATLAQEAFPLTGRVVDSLLRPVPTAVVATLAPDSEAMLQHAVTDDEGRFTLSASGRVRLFVSCLGFAPYVGEPFDMERATDVGELRLEGTAVGIDDVVVVAENPNATLRVEQGRMVYTPRNSASLAGGTALDALKQTPGVMVSGENEISLGGSSGVLVMLNGKQTYMQREELAAMLRSMPASSVSSVEVMSNPSAQYDAEGSAGVININVERGRSADGLSLSFNNGFSVWDNWRQNTELAFSCNTGRVSLYANYSHALGRTGLYYGMHRIQNGTDYLSPTDDEDRRRTVTGNVGVEYRPSEHHTLGARVDVNTLFGPGRTRTTTTVRDAATLDVESLLRASNDYYRQKGNRYGGTLFYTYAPREGEHYALDVDYAFFDGGAGCLQPNRYEDPAGVVLSDDLYRSVNSRAIDILALSYAQQHRLWGGTLHAGVKYSWVRADNDYRFSTVAPAGEQLDPSQSSRFLYQEQLLAAYLQYNRPLGRRATLEVGLRGEYTRSDGDLRRTDKLKGAATDAATVIISGVGSLFGSGKMKELEQSNEELHQEIAKRDKGIDDLKAQMQHMQEQHGRHIRNLQGIHNQELEAKDKEISRLNTLLEKAFKWFPMLREMLRMEKLCAAIGFTKEMIESLLTKKEAIRCNGRIYSEEYRRKFDIKNDVFKVERNPADDEKLVLTINKQPIGEWFKEQYDKLRQSLRQPIQPKRSQGMKL